MICHLRRRGRWAQLMDWRALAKSLDSPGAIYRRSEKTYESSDACKEEVQMQEIYQRLRQEVDELADEFLEFAGGMIRINSVNPPGHYDEISSYVHQRFSDFGFESRIIEVPLEKSEALGFDLKRKNVIATLNGATPRPCLVLNPHLDTVPVGDPSAWRYPPFDGVVADGRLWGRGACDCKGRVASFALAMAAIQRAGIPLRGTLVLAATADEEVGGELGTGYLVEEGYLDADWAIMEGFINLLFRGCGGMLAFRLQIMGKSAHTSTPWLGVNAIEKASQAIAALEDLQDEFRNQPSPISEFRHSTVNVGTIQGGLKDSVVPETCEIGVDLRLMPGHSPQEILARVREKMESLAAADPAFRYSLRVVRSEEPYLTDPHAPVVLALQNALEAVRGQPVPVQVSRGGSDAKYFIRRDIPAIAFGPGVKPDSMHHGVDEHIEIKDFVDASLITALAAVELLA